MDENIKNTMSQIRKAQLKAQERATEDREKFKKKMRNTANLVSLILILGGVVIWYFAYIH